MQTKVLTSPVTSPAARCCAVAPASLIALLGVVTTVFIPLAWLLGLTLAVTGSWSAVAGWKDPVRGVRRLLVPVIVLELLLWLMFEVALWTGSRANPPLVDARVVVVIALGLPPAYVLLRLTVRVLQERTRA